MADLFSLCWWRTTADRQEMKAPQAEIPENFREFISSENCSTSKKGWRSFSEPKLTLQGARLTLSPAPYQLLHPPPPLDSTRVGRKTEGKPSRSSGKAPKLLLFCSSAFPLDDQCHGLERQLWDIPPLPRNARNSCLEVVQFQQLVPTWEQGRDVLNATHPRPCCLQGTQGLYRDADILKSRKTWRPGSSWSC